MMNEDIQAPEPPEGIGKLSTELLIEIFAQLGLQDRLACSLVSKRWLKISRAWEFQGTLQITSSIAKRAIPELFQGRDFPFKKIVFSGSASCLWRKDWNAFWTFVKPHISEIVFGVCKYPALNFQVLERVLPMLPRLQKVTVLQHKIKFPKSWTDAIVLESLRELDLSQTEVPNSILAFLVDCCPILELLEVGQLTFKGSSAVEIIETLRTLYWVPAIKFHAFDAHFFKDQISELSSLSNVEFAGIVIEDAEIGNVLRWFATFQSHLDYVEIRGDSFHPLEQQLFEFLTRMDCVKYIKIVECEIDVNFTFNLFSRVKGLKRIKLESITFNCENKILKCTIAELKHLTISHCNCSCDRTLNNLLLVCPHLRTLSVPQLDFGFINSFPLIKRLTVTSAKRMYLSDFCILRSLERLTHLTIYGLRIESSDWEFFNFKTLKFFKILEATCTIRVEDLHGVVERNPTIREIQIQTNEIGQLNEESLKNTFGPNWSVDTETKMEKRGKIKNVVSFWAKIKYQNSGPL